MLKYWCIPFYYSEGYGLGDITSDEDEDHYNKNSTKKFNKTEPGGDLIKVFQQQTSSNQANNRSHTNLEPILKSDSINILSNTHSAHTHPHSVRFQSVSISTSNSSSSSSYSTAIANKQQTKNSSQSTSSPSLIYTSNSSPTSPLLNQHQPISSSSSNHILSSTSNNNITIIHNNNNSNNISSSITNLNNCANLSNNKKISLELQNSIVNNVCSNINNSLENESRNLPIDKIPTIQLQDFDNNNLKKANELASSKTESGSSNSNSSSSNSGGGVGSATSNNNNINNNNLTSQQSENCKEEIPSDKDRQVEPNKNRLKLKNMMRKNSKSHSPSKSYDEDRRKYFLNSLLNRYKTAKTNSAENEDGTNSPQSPTTSAALNNNNNSTSPATLSVNPKFGVKYAVSLDTYRRNSAQKLAREKAVEELDDLLLVENSSNLLSNSLNVSNSDNSKTGGNTTPNSSASTPIQSRKFKNNGISKMLTKELGSFNNSTSSLTSGSMTNGRVYMRVLYDSNTHVLSVTIIQSNKAIQNEKHKLFSKVQFHLLLVTNNKEVKEKLHKHKTTIKEYAEFIDLNESFYFPNVEKYELQNYTIIVNLYGKETFGSDKLLCQAFYPLGTLSLNEQYNYITLYFEEYKKPTSKKEDIESFLPMPSALDLSSSTSNSPSSNSKSNSNLNNAEKPNLLIGLKYDALIGILYVNILKGSNLYDRYASDKSPNTFVRVILKLEKSEVKFQTSIKRSSPNPVYEEAFEFSLDTYQVENAKLFIYVYSKRLLSNKNLIGCILFDDHPGHEFCVDHLKEAITSDAEFINRWHQLVFF